MKKLELKKEVITSLSNDQMVTIDGGQYFGSDMCYTQSMRCTYVNDSHCNPGGGGGGGGSGRVSVNCQALCEDYSAIVCTIASSGMQSS